MEACESPFPEIPTRLLPREGNVLTYVNPEDVRFDLELEGPQEALERWILTSSISARALPLAGPALVDPEQLVRDAVREHLDPRDRPPRGTESLEAYLARHGVEPRLVLHAAAGWAHELVGRALRRPLADQDGRLDPTVAEAHDWPAARIATEVTDVVETAIAAMVLADPRELAEKQRLGPDEETLLVRLLFRGPVGDEARVDPGARWRIDLSIDPFVGREAVAHSDLFETSAYGSIAVSPRLDLGAIGCQLTRFASAANTSFWVHRDSCNASAVGTSCAMYSPGSGLYRIRVTNALSDGRESRYYLRGSWTRIGADG